MKFFLSLIVFFISFFPLEAQVHNLNAMITDYVLDTKQIIIPDFPYAFNPSIVSYQNKILMSFRSYDPVDSNTDAIWFVWLDNKFNPISKPALLNRVGEVTGELSRAQDPRLIVINNQLLIVYSNLYPLETPVSRMYVGTVEIGNDGSFTLTDPTPLVHFEGQMANRKEKNWMPFAYRNNLLLSYSLQPHSVFLPILALSRCEPLTDTIGTIKWDWGKLAGGTPALLIGNSYLGFFHSNKALSSIQSGSKVMNHYFMGAYTFEAEYPFALTAISPHPIVAQSFYEGPMYNTWKPLRVVFPCGYIVDGNSIWVSYGRQDHEMWVVELDKIKLLGSLVPVQTVHPVLP